MYQTAVNHLRCSTSLEYCPNLDNIRHDNEWRNLQISAHLPYMLKTHNEDSTVTYLLMQLLSKSNSIPKPSNIYINLCYYTLHNLHRAHKNITKEEHGLSF